MTPVFNDYDRIVLAFSGGKDSAACLVALLEAGAPADKIELWHHDVDGAAGQFMDWGCTTAYCQALADAFHMPLYLSHLAGGFEREMDRDNTAKAATHFQVPGGAWQSSGGNGPLNTRGKFPQVSPDLSVRWCSAYLKIDVMDAALRGQDRFLTGRTLVVTGERAQESANRAKYKTFEPHRADSRNGTRKARYIDHWRPVHAWTEGDVWAALKRYGIIPHPAYQLGWGRLSCLACIFGNPNQWATIEAVYPSVFYAIANKEAGTGATIKRKQSVIDVAARGTPYPAALANPVLAALAMQTGPWTAPVLCAPGAWSMPAGAFGESAGPT